MPTGIDRQRRSGERSGAQRRHVEADTGGEQPVDVARQGPPVGEEVVGEQHRLRPLQVGVARQVGVAGVEGALQQHLLQPVDAPGDLEQFTFAPQAQVGRHLVVAAACRVQLAAGGTRDLGDASLDGGVDVLVALDEHERVRRHLVRHGVERVEHGVTFGVGEQADAGEAPHVGLGAVDVVAPHRAIEGQADGVGHQRLGRSAGEAAVPEGLAVPVVVLVVVLVVVRVGHVSPVLRGRGGGRPARRRRWPTTRTSACRRRRRCRAAPRRGCGRVPRRRRGRSRVVCAG